MKHEQNSANDASRGCGSLDDTQAAIVWFELSMCKALGAIGCIVGPISLTCPLWTAVGWSWPDALMGITVTGSSPFMFYVCSRLKRGFERSLERSG
jgi:hypothetical protein